MGRLDVVHWGSDRLRVGPWRGDPSIAQIVPSAGQLPRSDTIERCVDGLVDQGYRAVLTSALTHAEQGPFLEAGFEVHERLHLLRHDLRDLPPVRPKLDTPFRLRRGRRGDRAGALIVDGAAFSPFWRFDARGLDDARAATPSSRFRVVDDARFTSDGGVVGYAVTGRAGSVGYLQRLAVFPARHRRGIGRALVVDSLQWTKRRGASSLLVNTQESNGAAVELYEHLGFTREARGLAVLERHIAGSEAQG
jgi:ribosomal protein S18 acetylase RimI-like enzyme